MIVNIIVPDKTVACDGEGRFCPDLVVPDVDAVAYNWDGEIGFIQRGPGQDLEWFSDGTKLQFAVDAWDANPPPEPRTTNGPEAQEWLRNNT